MRAVNDDDTEDVNLKTLVHEGVKTQEQTEKGGAKTGDSKQKPIDFSCDNDIVESNKVWAIELNDQSLGLTSSQIEHLQNQNVPFLLPVFVKDYTFHGTDWKRILLEEKVTDSIMHSFMASRRYDTHVPIIMLDSYHCGALYNNKDKSLQTDKLSTFVQKMYKTSDLEQATVFVIQVHFDEHWIHIVRIHESDGKYNDRIADTRSRISKRSVGTDYPDAVAQALEVMNVLTGWKHGGSISLKASSVEPPTLDNDKEGQEQRKVEIEAKQKKENLQRETVEKAQVLSTLQQQDASDVTSCGVFQMSFIDQLCNGSINMKSLVLFENAWSDRSLSTPSRLDVVKNILQWNDSLPTWDSNHRNASGQCNEQPVDSKLLREKLKQCEEAVKQKSQTNSSEYFLHQNLRKLVCSQLMLFREKMEEYTTTGPTTFLEQIIQFTEPKVWSTNIGDIIPIVLAQSLRTTVDIYGLRDDNQAGLAQRITYSKNPVIDDGTMRLLRDAEGTHYSLLLLTNTEEQINRLCSFLDVRKEDLPQITLVNPSAKTRHSAVVIGVARDGDCLFHAVALGVIAKRMSVPYLDLMALAHPPPSMSPPMRTLTMERISFPKRKQLDVVVQSLSFHTSIRRRLVRNTTIDSVYGETEPSTSNRLAVLAFLAVDRSHDKQPWAHVDIGFAKGTSAVPFGSMISYLVQAPIYLLGLEICPDMFMDSEQALQYLYSSDSVSTLPTLQKNLMSGIIWEASSTVKSYDGITSVYQYNGSYACNTTENEEFMNTMEAIINSTCRLVISSKFTPEVMKKIKTVRKSEWSYVKVAGNCGVKHGSSNASFHMWVHCLPEATKEHREDVTDPVLNELIRRSNVCSNWTRNNLRFSVTPSTPARELGTMIGTGVRDSRYDLEWACGMDLTTRPQKSVKDEPDTVVGTIVGVSVTSEDKSAENKIEIICFDFVSKTVRTLEITNTDPEPVKLRKSELLQTKNGFSDWLETTEGTEVQEAVTKFFKKESTGVLVEQVRRSKRLATGTQQKKQLDARSGKKRRTANNQDDPDHGDGQGDLTGVVLDRDALVKILDTKASETTVQRLLQLQADITSEIKDFKGHVPRFRRGDNKKLKVALEKDEVDKLQKKMTKTVQGLLKDWMKASEAKDRKQSAKTKQSARSDQKSVLDSIEDLKKKLQSVLADTQGMKKRFVDITKSLNVGDRRGNKSRAGGDNDSPGSLKSLEKSLTELREGQSSLKQALGSTINPEKATAIISSMSSFTSTIIGQGGISGLVSNLTHPRTGTAPGAPPIAINIGQQNQPGTSNGSTNQAVLDTERNGVTSYTSPALRTDKPLDELSSDEIYDWCAKHGFTNYREEMRKRDINGRHLMNLVEEDMQELAMTRVHIRTLIEIQKEFEKVNGHLRRY